MTLPTEIRVCEICGAEPWGINGDERDLCQDHNHKTGTLRGLLCHRCNVGIGMFRDRPTLLKNASKYLLKYQEELIVINR